MTILDRRPGEAISRNVRYRPDGWNLCSRVGQSPQDVWTSLIIATLVKCIHDKFGWQGKERMKSRKRVFSCQVRVAAKTNPPKWWGEFRGFVDESWEDISKAPSNSPQKEALKFYTIE